MRKLKQKISDRINKKVVDNIRIANLYQGYCSFDSAEKYYRRAENWNLFKILVDSGFKSAKINYQNTKRLRQTRKPLVEEQLRLFNEQTQQ